MASLYKILEQIGNFYKIKLLKTIRVYLVFLSNRLRKAASNPLLSQKKRSFLFNLSQ